jgi:hypothetical protein
LVSLHAEEAAINSIYKKWINRYNIRDLTILIWKQAKNGTIKPVYCCDWCRKYITKHNINPDSVITFTQLMCDFSNSIIDENTLPQPQSQSQSQSQLQPQLPINNTNTNTPLNISYTILIRDDYYISALSMTHHMPTLFKKSARCLNMKKNKAKIICD